MRSRATLTTARCAGGTRSSWASARCWASSAAGTACATRLSRLAAFLPLPQFLRRSEETSQASAGGGSSLATQAHIAFSNFSHIAVSGATVEHAASAIQKAAAVVTAAAVLGGGGIVANQTRTVPMPQPVVAKRAVAAPVMAQRQAGKVRLVTPLTAPLVPTDGPPLVQMLSAPAALLTSLSLPIIPAVEPQSAPEEPASETEEPAAAEPPPVAAPSEPAAEGADPDPPAKEDKAEETGGASSAPSDSADGGTEFVSPDPNTPLEGTGDPVPPPPIRPATAAAGERDLPECVPPAPAGCAPADTATVP